MGWFSPLWVRFELRMKSAKSLQAPARIDWRGIGWMFLYFWYFSGVTHLMIKLGDNAGFSGLRQSVLMSVIWLAPVLLFPARSRAISSLFLPPQAPKTAKVDPTLPLIQTVSLEPEEAPQLGYTELESWRQQLKQLVLRYRESLSEC